MTTLKTGTKVRRRPSPHTTERPMKTTTIQAKLTAAGACLIDEVSLYGSSGSFVVCCEAKSEADVKDTLTRIRNAAEPTHGQTVRSWYEDYDAKVWRGVIYLLKRSDDVLKMVEEINARRREAA